MGFQDEIAGSHEIDHYGAQVLACCAGRVGSAVGWDVAGDGLASQIAMRVGGTTTG
ncbi:hypothetical protein V6Z77_005777 [Aspergillus fumigatus]|jgi:hypothetical protein|uniref:Uncharacterized protein n=1 Tax=Aspergillus fumigatus (strain CBS 144.89 / FGSC A1163 / CEA10) TaxID=451804 RepID=B0Y8M3_ASPFC|nr:conserved hypothetical protein [Aspergillus fumigatus A1163]